MNYKNNILEMIGETPIIKLNNVMKRFNLKSNIFAKVERCNPTGSIKDRIAKEMILKALEDKLIDKDTTIIEPTSGNTGIGLAAICASLNMKCIILMPSNASIERVKIMKAYGAKIIITDANLGGMSYCVNEAKKLQKTIENSFIPSQFDNTANVEAHYKSTGKEIYRDLDGQVDFFVAGFGTGGTLSGVSKFLKEKNKDIFTVGVEPSSSAFVSKNEKGKHKIQGIGAGFKPDNLKLEYVDKIVTVSDDDAYNMTRLLAEKEGLFVGISSGCNVFQAVEIAKTNVYKNIVTVLPDNGERYLSVEGLFNE